MESYNKSELRRSNPLMASINLIPFIDIVLVLLIVFMVTPPASNNANTSDVVVELPALSATTSSPDYRKKKIWVVTLQADRSLLVRANDIEFKQPVFEQQKLLGFLKENYQNNLAEVQMFVAADKAVQYGDLMALYNSFSELGIQKIGLVVEQL